MVILPKIFQRIRGIFFSALLVLVCESYTESGRAYAAGEPGTTPVAVDDNPSTGSTANSTNSQSDAQIDKKSDPSQAKKAQQQTPSSVVGPPSGGGASQASYAGSGSGSPNVHPWADDSKYRPCEQNCLYDKANENISFQAIYSARKLELIEAVSDPDKREETIKNELVNFCMVGEDTEKCFLRYKQSQYYVLNQMKNSLVRNEDAVARLGLNSKKTSWIGNKRNKGKEAQTPYIPTFQDMAAYYDGLNQVAKTVGTDEYVAWTRETFRAPELKDFLLYKTVPKDSADPSSASILMKAKCEEVKPKGGCECDSDGCYDVGEFKASQVKYEQWAKAMGDDFKQLRNPQNPNLKLKNPMLAPKLNAAVGEISLRAYRDARNAMVQARNKVLGNPTPSRKPSQVRGNSGSSQGTVQDSSAGAGSGNKTSGSSSDQSKGRPIDLLPSQAGQSAVFDQGGGEGKSVSVDQWGRKSNNAQGDLQNRDLEALPDRRPADDRDDVFVNVTPDLIKKELENIEFK